MHYTLRGKIARAHPYQLDETLTLEGAGAEAKAVGEAINAVKKITEDHGKETSNPHKVTKAQVGLGEVDNTSDTNKPVSTAQAEAIETAKNEAIAVGRKAESDASAAGASALAAQELARAAQSSANKAQSDANAAGASALAAQELARDAIPSSEKGKASGVATLNSDSKVTASQASSSLKFITAANHTISKEDAGCMLVARNTDDPSQSWTFNLPGGDDDSIPIGTEIEILSYTKSGSVQIKAPSGRYLLYAGCPTTSTGGSLNIANTYGVVCLKKIFSSSWIAAGDIK